MPASARTSKVQANAPFARHAVFLLDTSLSEHPDRFAVHMALLRRILENDPDITQFNVLTFDVAGRWVDPRGWLANTKEGRNRVFATLDGLLLEGATDLSAALEHLVAPSFEVAQGTPLTQILTSSIRRPSPGRSMRPPEATCRTYGPTGSSSRHRGRRCITTSCSCRARIGSWKSASRSMRERTFRNNAWRGPASTAPASRVTTA
ncbi:MAG: VWA domain-containing protein [Gemmataceae bacterium]|nr:VWA domain-containing protein [Gemmataceae bacterium]